jgi:hypothetical protein
LTTTGAMKAKRKGADTYHCSITAKKSRACNVSFKKSRSNGPEEMWGTFPSGAAREVGSPVESFVDFRRPSRTKER